jgi:radical SAM-linked protein
MIRLRIAYSKTAHMRFTGHLDLYRTWERLIRRARLPLAYTQGFNPHPKINLSPALPLGFTSECELIDIWLEADIPLKTVLDRLKNSAPPGIIISAVQEIDLGAPAIQNQVVSALYAITLQEPLPDLREKVKQLLAADTLPRERRGKSYDLRPLIESLAIEDPGSPAILSAQLACREGATGRPEEVLAELGYPANLALVHRKMFFWLEETAASEPVPDSISAA